MRELQTRKITEISDVEALLYGWNIHSVENNGKLKILENNNIGNLPSAEEIQIVKKQIIEEEEASLYREYRKREYPPIGDQLDSLYHAGIFPEEMREKIENVKNKYPK